MSTRDSDKALSNWNRPTAVDNGRGWGGAWFLPETAVWWVGNWGADMGDNAQGHRGMGRYSVSAPVLRPLPKELELLPPAHLPGPMKSQMQRPVRV